MKREFTCALCKEKFVSEITDEELCSDCQELYGITDGTLMIGFTTDYICDECFQLIRPDKELVKN